MYYNIHYDKYNEEIICFDSEKGQIKESAYKYKYAYVNDPNGDYVNLFGAKVRKIDNTEIFKYDPSDLYESDIDIKTRYLIDNYGDTISICESNMILNFDIEVSMLEGLPDAKIGNNPITSIALKAKTSEIVLILDPKGEIESTSSNNIYIVSCKDEISLIELFYTFYKKINPTILTGWNIDDFDIPYLYNRTVALLGKKFANKLSPIGKVMLHDKFGQPVEIVGVTSLDYMQLYKKFTFKALPSYSLEYVCNYELKRGKNKYAGTLDDLYKTDKNAFIEYNLEDVRLVNSLDQKLGFLPMVIELAHECHVPYIYAMESSRFLEGVILTYLKMKNIVAPNKPPRIKERFDGAYVKEPQVGLHKWVYDLDLESLYPSAIRSLNASPETKVGKLKDFDLDLFKSDQLSDYNIYYNNNIHKRFSKKADLLSYIKSDNISMSSSGVFYTLDKEGIIPEVLTLWFSRRKEFKALVHKYDKLGDATKVNFYDKRQHIQKIYLNSIYGVLGLAGWRFADVDNALSTTSTGQRVIKFSQDVSNEYYVNNGYCDKNKDNVIYIDTDSIFLSAEPYLISVLGVNYLNEYTEDEIAQYTVDFSNIVEKYINNRYRDLCIDEFNIDPDKSYFNIKQEYVSKSAFWVAKKNYAQLAIREKGLKCDKLDIKGLATVKSSFPPSFGTCMHNVLTSILNFKDNDYINDMINTFIDDMRKNPLESIAKVTSIQIIDKYESITDDLNYIKGTPYHIKAAMAYNFLIDIFDLSNSVNPMRPGEKVKLIYLHDNQYKINAICFRGSEQDPERIYNFIKEHADYNKMFESELANKFESFYSAMNWKLYNKNAETFSAFFD